MEGPSATTVRTAPGGKDSCGSPTVEVHNLLARCAGLFILVVDVLGGLILATGLLLGLDLLADKVTEPRSLISSLAHHTPTPASHTHRIGRPWRRRFGSGRVSGYVVRIRLFGRSTVSRVVELEISRLVRLRRPSQTEAGRVVTCDARLEGKTRYLSPRPTPASSGSVYPGRPAPQRAYPHNCIHDAHQCVVAQGTVYPEPLSNLGGTAGLLVSKMRGNSKEGQNTRRSERNTRSSPSLSISTSDGDEGLSRSKDNASADASWIGLEWSAHRLGDWSWRAVACTMVPSESGSLAANFTAKRAQTLPPNKI